MDEVTKGQANLVSQLNKGQRLHLDNLEQPFSNHGILRSLQHDNSSLASRLTLLQSSNSRLLLSQELKLELTLEGRPVRTSEYRACMPPERAVYQYSRLENEVLVAKMLRVVPAFLLQGLGPNSKCL